MSLQEDFELFKTMKPIPLPEKVLVLSDIHAGAGDRKDSLLSVKVEPLLLNILEEYLANKYTLFKNGDWWDTWRGMSLLNILVAHRPLMLIVDKFRDAGLLYETLGNHERNLCSYPEALVFKGFNRNIFLFHGWFGDWPNDEGWKIGRDVVRMAAELGIGATTSPHESNVDRHLAVRKAVEELASINSDWDFLWGHTHYFSNEGNNHNSGSSLCGWVVGYTIEEGIFIPFERRTI